MAVSDQDLEEALSIAAKMIDLYGYKYWPIFERLEAELEARSDRIRRVQARLPTRNLARNSKRHLGSENLINPSS